MFKKAISTVACMDLSYDKVIKECVNYHINGIEIRQGNDGSIFGFTTYDELVFLKNIISENGLIITDIGSSVCFENYNTDIMSKAKDAVNIAEILETKAIRVFLGYFEQKVNPNKKVPDYDGIIAALKELCDYADKKNIEIWVETHNEFSTGEVLSKLYSDVSRINLRFIWDIIHPIEDGEDIETTWDKIGTHIAHIHIKDGIKRDEEAWHDYEYTCLNHGELPLYSILDLLNNVGFDGYLSFEWETAWRPEISGYPNDLSYVLKMYNSFFDGYINNNVPGFTDAWFCFDSYNGNITKNVIVSDYKTNAKIILKDGSSMLKYFLAVKVDDNSTYKISVPFNFKNAINRKAAYAMATLIDSDGNVKRRLYLKRKSNGKFESEISTVGETQLCLELGLKNPGEVIWYHPSVEKCECMSERRIRAAAIHMQIKRGIDYNDNLKRLESAFDKTASNGVDLIAFSETIGDRGTTLATDEIFESDTGKFCTLMRKKAIQHNCYVFFTFHEKDEKNHKHNTAILFDRQGNMVGKYRKSHLALAEYEEGMIPGNEYPVFDTEFGKIGMLVCWDAYFPEPARAMALQGAEILLISTAGNPTFRHIARAKENGAYVIVACASQENDLGILPTKIIDPTGKILSQTDEDSDCAYYEINLNKPNEEYWLSVGDANTFPRDVYMNEYRDDLLEHFKEM